MSHIDVGADLAPESAPRVVRWIVGAMSAGLFSATVVFALVGPLGSGDDAPMWLGVIGAVGLASFGGWTVYDRMVLASLRARWAGRSDPEAAESELVQPFVTRSIVGAALAEGPGLLAGVVYFLTGHWLALLAIVVALYALTRFYPRDDGYRRFVGLVTGSQTDPS